MTSANDGKDVSLCNESIYFSDFYLFLFLHYLVTRLFFSDFIGPNGFRQTRTGEVAAQEQPQTQPLKKVNDDYFADQAEVVK